MKIELVNGGAHGSARALAITAVAPDLRAAPGAGVSFVPSSSGFDPVDLSTAKAAEVLGTRRRQDLLGARVV
jgi:hypothetical protein